MAHRGGAEVYEPETWNAYNHATKYAQVLEADLRFTSDGVIVIQHDNLVDGKTTDKEIDETKWSYFRDTFTTDEGNKVMTLGSLCRIAQTAGKHVSLEFKTNPSNDQIKKVKSEITKYNLQGRCRIWAFDDDVIKKVRAVGGLYTGINSSTVVGLTLAKAMGSCVCIGLGSLNPTHMRNYKNGGVSVFAYTTNTDAEDKLAFDLGVDGVITDRPARTAALWRAYVA